MRLKRIAALAAVLLLALPGAVRAQLPTPEVAQAWRNNPWVGKIKERGVLKVGFDTFVPWAMKNKKGAYVGFEIEVALALADDLGVAAEFVPTAWDGIIPALLTSKFDVIIGGMGITEERRQRVAFTDPYEFSGIGIAASRISAPGLSSLSDFNKKNIVVAVKGGTTAAIAAKELLPEATIEAFDTEGQTMQELLSGRAQAILAGAPFPADLAARNPDRIYVPISGTLTQEPIGMALNPRDTEALPALNAWIGSRQAGGWLSDRWSYWFETLDWEPKVR
ncbi:MAG: transporter substrate-binding domain-containing protein [Candidatus Adiutrix sp.]|jgi:polar amino acid transport system substrate-binding protein|nr:transporter substrate-binding domain-containing protein [Candidatus Adiutrix sp.]